jgi:hypothetical protein
MKISLLIPTTFVAVAMAGCVVVPAGRPVYAAPPPGVAYVAPPGVAYIAPTYAIPGPGYVWAYHAHYGWGWHHPQYGWHRGWK